MNEKCTLKEATKYELQMSSEEIFFNNHKTSFKHQSLGGNGLTHYNWYSVKLKKGFHKVLNTLIY